jgi:hypothetical protein
MTCRETADSRYGIDYFRQEKASLAGAFLNSNCFRAARRAPEEFPSEARKRTFEQMGAQAYPGIAGLVALRIEFAMAGRLIYFSERKEGNALAVTDIQAATDGRHSSRRHGV